MRMKMAVLSMVAVAAMVLPVSAAPLEAGDRILMDFYTNDTFHNSLMPQDCSDDLGRIWNAGLTASTNNQFSNLKNTAGVETDVSITWVAGMTGINGHGAGRWNTPLRLSELVDYPEWVTCDSVSISTGNTAQSVIAGLDAEITYNITFYGSRNVLPSDRPLTVTIGEQSLTYFSAGEAGEGMVTFTNVAPDANGTITVQYHTPEDYGYLGAIDITAVPEPATMSLVGGALACLFARRRR